MPTDTWLNRKAVSDLIGRNYDTIRRYEKLGRYPHARRDPLGAVEIPLGDLVAAGDYDPAAAEDAPEATIANVPSDREAQQLREELAATRANLAGLEQQLLDVRDERDFLRKMLQQQGRVA